MNFLAHIYLSGSSKELIIGNFLGDFIKGQEIEKYPKKIKLGIRMHRAIDSYTDSHDIVLRSKNILREKYRHYSPVIVDMFYDHFLAANWSDFSNENLPSFTQRFYTTVDEFRDVLPANAKKVFQYMKRDNWLLQYQFVEGIHKALSGMSRRTSFESKMEKASEDLLGSYQDFKTDFQEFFPQLVSFSNSFISKNSSK